MHKFLDIFYGSCIFTQVVPKVLKSYKKSINQAFSRGAIRYRFDTSKYPKVPFQTTFYLNSDTAKSGIYELKKPNKQSFRGEWK